jgi:hypothetical protein
MNTKNLEDVQIPSDMPNTTNQSKCEFRIELNNVAIILILATVIIIVTILAIYRI